jgi:hypothetical protein
MQPEAIIKYVVNNFSGVIPKSSWGETALFYNPEKALPHGVYFCTLKEKNGDNDQSSALARDGIFRLSIGISKGSYDARFGPKPKRPAKGGIIDTGHDFSALNELMPHPIYGWMNWVQILSPTESKFAEIIPLINEAHASVMLKFNKKTNTKIALIS